MTLRCKSGEDENSFRLRISSSEAGNCVEWFELCEFVTAVGVLGVDAKVTADVATDWMGFKVEADFVDEDCSWLTKLAVDFAWVKLHFDLNGRSQIR